MDECEIKWNELHPAPFTLFQGEDGRWGTKDAKGKVYDKPVYYRVEKEGEVIFNNGIDEACSFDPREGMSLICYCEPWWVEPFDMVKFPEKYNGYIMQCIKSKTELTSEEMRNHFSDLLDNVKLDDAQRQAVAGLMMMTEWEDADDDEYEKIEEEWFRRFPDDRNAGKRIAVLEPLMERNDIPGDSKRILWFANFRFISLFCI